MDEAFAATPGSNVEPLEPSDRTVAAIDIGANSVRMVIAQVDPDGGIEMAPLIHPAESEVRVVKWRVSRIKTPSDGFSVHPTTSRAIVTKLRPVGGDLRALWKSA